MTRINPNDVLNSALAMRAARESSTATETMESLLRLMAEHNERILEVLMARLEAVEATALAQREAMETHQELVLERMRQTAQAVVEAIGEIRIANNVRVPQIQIPETKVAGVRVEPKISVPAAEVRVERPEMPKRLVIKHSDGTQSTIKVE